MYIPKLYRQEDEAQLLAFMRRYSFATLVSARHNIPTATPLPFVVEKREGHLLLSSHLAKANSQWQDLEAGEVLVIFQEPHAYVSPRHYAHQQNVPTWNYVAVHAYGRVRLIEAEQEGYALLEKMIQTYEPEYLLQWQGLPEAYREKMLRGIVAFEMEVRELQGKEKLSQNRTAAERATIIGAFERSPDPQEAEIGRLMNGKEGQAR